ncbi:hypothetical protein GCM10022419_099920 [Nonomuraea rosea]|uniref:Uncharacterized protein n=1 Tax=Nonomuraea rosea TaxID=638574 RepID=A0ABP6Z769_9ACTN
MDQTRKMWASAAIVGVIVAGGVSIAAAASAGKLEQVGKETRAVVEKATPSSRPPVGPQESTGPGPELGTEVETGPTPETTDDGIVVSTEVNPDPGKVVEYWTDKRMEEAQPMPMPEVSAGEAEVTE